MKKIISIIIALSLVLGLAACGENNTTAPEIAKEPSYILSRNNIEFNPLPFGEENEWGSYDSQSIEISGLKNFEVEQSINDRIAAEFADLASWSKYPAYRGVYYDLQKIKDLEPTYDAVYATEFCNVGNILSIVIDAQKTYETIDSNGYYNSIVFDAKRPLNFDLNTGELIKITDIFAPGIDGIKYINDYINNIINTSSSDEEGYFYSDGWDSFKLVGSFPGITEDQAFYISSYGDTLILLLDDKTPWVYLDTNYPSFITIDITKLSCLDSKYIKENIYEDESENYVLLYNNYDPLTVITESKYEDDYLGIPGTYFGEMLSYSSEMPDYQVKIMKDFIDSQQPKIDKFVETYLTDGRLGNFDISVYASRVGKYTALNFYSYYGAYYDWYYGDANLYNETESYSILFKEGQSEPLTIEDLFVPGYDFSTWDFDPHGYSFELSIDAINLRTDNDYRTVYYHDIGCENLTIFD